MRLYEASFTLVEVIATLAIVAMIAALALPRLSLGTTRPVLEAYALRTVAILKADRVTALRRGVRINKTIDATTRTLTSGASATVLQLPEDIAFDAIVPEFCEGRRNRSAMTFLPDGMPCGGTVALALLGMSYAVRPTLRLVN